MFGTIQWNVMKLNGKEHNGIEPNRTEKNIMRSNNCEI